MNDWAAGLHNAVDGARNYDAPERSWIYKNIASYYKGDIARLSSSRQRNELKIDVNNAEWSFAGKACKEKEGPNNWVSEMAKSWS